MASENKLELIFEGVPCVQKRHRDSIRGGKYDPSSAEKKIIRIKAMVQMRDKRVLRHLKGPIKLEMSVGTVIPKSWSQKRRKEVSGKYDTRRPDCDNYLKLYQDALNGLVYADDSEIVDVHVTKKYDEKPFVKLIFEEIDERS